MAALVQRLLRGQTLLPMLGLFALLLTVLVLMSDATENSTQFGRLYSWLLLSSATGLLLLTLLIGHHLYRLLVRYQSGEPGSRLTLRLVVLFVVISMAPVAVVYYFSLQFLQKGIDSWFDVEVDKGLEDALKLSRRALDLRMREVLKQTVRMADELSSTSEGFSALVLGEMRNNTDATELTLIGKSGRIIAAASVEPWSIVPDLPSEVIMMHVRQGYEYVSLDPIRGFGFQIRSVVRLPVRGHPDEPRIFQTLFPVSERFSQLADSTQSAFERYKELIFLRTPLKASFILTLSLVLLLSVLAALWAAVYAARRLVEPVQELAQGTRAVAAGQYDKQLPMASKDELGFLVQSFNQMTRNLAQARDTAQHSQQLVERQRTYLQAVLARLSSGVLTLDQEGCLRTCNAAAGQILGLDLNAFVGIPLSVCEEPEPLKHFFEPISPHLQDGDGEWREEITLFGSHGRQVLMCRGSSLPDPAGRGHVIVFDDITTLVRAERDAAWTEVARRLAHEIKNPLTPIQLAAERIRHKYLKTLDPAQSRVLDRGTHTIVQQVQAMKEMVDDFNEYARPSRLQVTQLRLNEFISEIMYLYRDYPAGLEIQLDLDRRESVIKVDKGRLRQLIHNLVKNGIEAIKDGQGSTLCITTRCHREAGWVDLGFQDDGPGFPEDVSGDIFEPYVTTKAKGTGLGLAIVKKIVEEHGGVIRLEPPEEGGAKVIIRFPMISVAADKKEVVRVAATVLSDTKEAG